MLDLSSLTTSGKDMMFSSQMPRLSVQCRLVTHGDDLELPRYIFILLEFQTMIHYSKLQMIDDCFDSLIETITII